MESPKPNNSDSLQAYEDLYKNVKIAEALKKKEPKENIDKISEETINFDSMNSLQICRFHDPLIMRKDANFLDRNTPIADKFFMLTREDDSVSAT